MLLHSILQAGTLDGELGEEEVGETIPQGEEALQQVGRLDRLIPALTSQLDSALQGFLGFDCILIDIHLHLVFFGELCCSHLRRCKGRAVGVTV